MAKKARLNNAVNPSGHIFGEGSAGKIIFTFICIPFNLLEYLRMTSWEKYSMD